MRTFSFPWSLLGLVARLALVGLAASFTLQPQPALAVTPVAAPAVQADKAPPPAKSPAAEPGTPRLVWGRLVAQDGKTTYDLDKQSVVVGSAAPADVVVPGSTLSPQHCRITYDAGRVAIEDLGSRHGTLVAGTALKKGKPMAIVQPLDLALGAVSLRFEFGERPAVIPPLKAAKHPGKKAKGKGKGKAKSAGAK